jgi:Glycosyltransferase family 87
MKTLKIIVNAALVCLLVWFLVSHEQKVRASTTGRDSISYWAAANLLLHHQNPYAPLAVLSLERTQGYAATKPLVLRTPPWSLWMVLPLGFLTSYWAWIAWLAILLISLVIAMRISWRMYGDGPRASNIFLLTGYLFAPVAACLVASQLGLVLLLGIVLFLLLEEERPFLAGAALLIPFAKPHIFGLLWPILAIWIFSRKKWLLLAGMAAAFLLTNSIALAFDPSIFQHYRAMLQQQAIQYEFIPALSGMLRLLFFRRFFWVQFLPAAVGLLWSFSYYWKHQRTWSWREHGPAVLVVSILTTPYSWMTDEVVLLPAILQGALWLNRAKLKVRSQLVILLLVFLDLVMLLILKAQVPMSTGIYFWSSLVWFSCYWYARSFAPRSDPAIKIGCFERLSKN